MGLGLYCYTLAPNPKAIITKQENTKPGSSVCQADIEKKKKTKPKQKNLQDKYIAPILEASSKSWINRSQQWHNLPVTSVGLVIYRLPFEEGTVQEKSSSHHTQLSSYLHNNWPWLLPHSSRLGTSKKSLMQQVPVC